RSWRSISCPQFLERSVARGFNSSTSGTGTPLIPRLFTGSGRTWVRYDPRNLARVFVPIPGRDEYMSVPYADLRPPPISLGEQQAAVREILDHGRRSANEEAIFATIEQQ